MHTSFPRQLIAILVSVVVAATASAQTTRLAFDFTGIDPARNLPWTKTSVREASLTTEGWRFGSGISLVAASNDRLAFSVSSDANLSTLAQAKSNNAYLYVRLAASSGTLNLAGNRVNFTIRRESWHTPLQYAVFSSADNYATAIFTTPLLDNADAATDAFTFLLPSSGYSSISGPIELRIYPFAARYTGHPASLTAFSMSTAAQTYTLSLSATTGGTAQASPAGTVFEAGQSVQLTAIPSTGYAFAGWQGNATGTANPLTLTVNSNLSITAAFVVKPVVPMAMAGNLEAIVDWSTAWVFKDCFKMSRTWMTRNADGSGSWDSAQRANVDANGWPLAVPYAATSGGVPQILHTLLPLCDAGTYTVRFQGTGSIDLIPPAGGARQTIAATGGTTTRTYTFNPTLADNMLYLEVRQSSSTDPVRNIQVVAPGQDT
ncbi:MAG: InlB B-repeat-containing protein, partial [Chthoniobacterales bacterium]